MAVDPGDEVDTRKLPRPRLVAVTRRIGGAFGAASSPGSISVVPGPLRSAPASAGSTERWPPGPPADASPLAFAMPVTGVRPASARPPGSARLSAAADAFPGLMDEDATDDPAEYLALLGGDRGVPRSRVPSHEIRSVCDDPREAFLLSLLDGVSTTREIVDSSGMPELDALGRLHRLLERDLIALDLPGSLDLPEN